MLEDVNTSNRPGVVYTLTDKLEPDRVRYVGLTRRKPQVRLSGHWTECLNGGTRPVNNFMRKRLYDRSRVVMTVIDECATDEELKCAEIEWIAFYRSLGQADLNLTDGGEGMWGYRMSEEQKEAKRQSMIGRFRGEHYRGEVKLSWEKVREIRSRAKAQWVSQQDLADEYGVTQSVIMKVLLNRAWIDDDYDPSGLPSRPPESHANNRQTTREVVDAIRALRMREWVPEREIGRRYGLTRSNVQNILSGVRWPDPTYDPSKLVRAGGNGTGSKLTAEDVVRIKERCAAGEFQRVVAADYGIQQTQVSRIVRGVRWAGVK